jgi:NitT/TauT family transport system substrate-binding protein
MAEDLSTLSHTSIILKGSGLIEEELNLNASWRRFPNGPSMIEAFERRDFDLGYLAPPLAMIGICRGLGIRCVAGGHVDGTVLISPQSFQGAVSSGDVLSQFVGRCIGTLRRGTIHDVIIRRLISQSGLSGKVEVRNFEYADFIIDAMDDGEIEGGCGTSPLAVLAKRQMESRILIPPSRMWPFNPSYGIVASNRFIQDPLPEEYISSAMAFVQGLMDLGYINKRLDIDDVFYCRAIKKVHRALDHYSDPGMLTENFEKTFCKVSD